MGALSKKRSRSIDSLWRGNDALIAAVEAAVGVSIGSDDGVLFIQDVGTKVAGRAYIDVNTGKMYKCINGTSSISNDSNFSEMGIDKNSNDITILSSYETNNDLTPSGMSYVTIVRVGNVVFLGIDTGDYMNTNYTPGAVLFTLPPEYRPRGTFRFGTITSFAPNSPQAYPLVIYPDGNVQVYSAVPVAANRSAFYGAITYTI